MVNFKEIQLSDKEWITNILKKANYQGCDYSFANLYMWREPSQITVAEVDGFLCIMGQAHYEKEPVYVFPAGNGNIGPIIEKLERDAEERNIRFRLRAAGKEQAEYIKELFPGRFEAESMRGEWDYLYLVENLTNLAGKKYHGKRNHIARFKDDNNWSYERITEDNLGECMEMNDAWCRMYGCREEDGKRTEQCAVREAAQNFSALGLEGGLLRKGGEVVAFTMGEPLNDITYVVHIEKAFSDVQGAYPMINQQFVIDRMQDFLYVNREEDMGEEGLRKAKLSYKPDLLLEKYTIVKKNTIMRL